MTDHTQTPGCHNQTQKQQGSASSNKSEDMADYYAKITSKIATMANNSAAESDIKELEWFQIMSLKPEKVMSLKQEAEVESQR